jgi:hypothetical protein
VLLTLIAAGGGERDGSGSDIKGKEVVGGWKHEARKWNDDRVETR